MGLSTTVTLDALAAELERTLQQMEKAFRSDALKKKLAVVAVADVKNHFTQGRAPDGTPWPRPKLRDGQPLLDTGRTRASVRGDVTSQGVGVSVAGVQARLMNDGGTVRARKKFLAIPATAAARRAGSPRNMRGLHFEVRKGASVGRIADAAGETVFYLKDAVYIPPRPFDGFSEQGLGYMGRLVGDEVARAAGG